jgi:hypothetical protein
MAGQLFRRNPLVWFKPENFTEEIKEAGIFLW